MAGCPVWADFSWYAHGRRKVLHIGYAVYINPLTHSDHPAVKNLPSIASKSAKGLDKAKELTTTFLTGAVTVGAKLKGSPEA